MTAAEFAAQPKDPKLVAAQKRKLQEIEARAAQNRRDSKPVRDELAALGFEVESVADLYNGRMHYEVAVPVLLKWLPKTRNPWVEQELVRALTVRWARPEAAPMVLRRLRELRNTDEDSLRFAYANALSEVADYSVFTEVAELARDKHYSKAERGCFYLGLSNVGANRDAAVALLREELRGDIPAHAITALGNLRAIQARGETEPFVEHEDAWVRNEAKKALRKLDTAERKAERGRR